MECHYNLNNFLLEIVGIAIANNNKNVSVLAGGDT